MQSLSFKLFILVWLLSFGSVTRAYVPRQQDGITLTKEEAENIKNGNYLGLSRNMSLKPELEHYLYTITDFNGLSVESIDQLARILNSRPDLKATLQNCYRPQRIVSLIDQIQGLTIDDVAKYRELNPHQATVIDDVVALSIDSVASDILFEEYLYLRSRNLISNISEAKNAYQGGKAEYIASIRKSVDEYLDYEAKIFNAVFYLESLKAWERMNVAFKEIAKAYSDYEAPKSLDKMKAGFEQLVNSYDSKKNVSIIAAKMEKFQNQCSVNREEILNSFLLSGDMMPQSKEIKLKATSPHKFSYQASTGAFSDFYSYKASLEKKNATVGLAGNVVGLFTGFLGSMAVNAVSGAYKSSNIKDIAKKDFDTRKIYILDAYNKSCANLSEQMNKLEKSLRAQYDQNIKKLRNDISNIK